MIISRLNKLLLLGLIYFLFNGSFASGYLYLTPGLTDLSISTDGKTLILNDESAPGLYLLSLDGQNPVKLIAAGRGVAYRAQWSKDNRYIAFKKITGSGQIPCLYDRKSESITELHSPVPASGIPSFSNTGNVVFTIDSTLYLRGLQRNILRTFTLPGYANISPVSADGKFVVFNDLLDKLYLLNLSNGKTKILFKGESGLFGPLWSANDSLLAVSSLSGRLFIYNIISGQEISLGEGCHPSWSTDGSYLFFTKYKTLPERGILDADIYRVNKNGSGLQKIEDQGYWADFPVQAQNGTFLFSGRKAKKLFMATLKSANKNKVLSFEQLKSIELYFSETVKPASALGPARIAQLENEHYFDIPYVHQRYDTPDWFDGDWACGATAAIMCIGYYDILPEWPEWVSIPSKHISTLGNYICSKYTYNGYTFDIWAADPNGVKGYGGYGHIVRNGSQAWSDTKGNMADYAKKHGLSSSVDWSANRNKLISEINNQKPFVLLSSITSAGHYLSVIGYANPAGTTVIMNDPWGNKNYGYPSYNGRRAHYDWPGYTNGNANLNTVHCFIYFRGNPVPHPDLSSLNLALSDTLRIGKTFQISTAIRNSGNGASQPAQAALIFSENADYEYYDTCLDTFPLAGIASQDSVLLNKTFVFNDSVISNYYYLGVYADYDSVNHEMVRENNCSLSLVKVFGYPRIYGLHPENGTLISTSKKPEIYAKYRDKFGLIDTSSVFLFLDDKDISPLCEKTSNKISYSPQKNLAAGQHHLGLQVLNGFGLTSSQKWTFTIKEETGMAREDQLRKFSKFSLEQNYPNPMNSQTLIRFHLTENADTKVQIFNVLGQNICTLFDGWQKAGSYQVRWNGKDYNGNQVSSGLYLIRLTSKDHSKIKRMLYLK